MCMCQKPTVNGQPGYSWDGKHIGVYPVDPPALSESDTVVFDEPGRCGGQDSHSFHYRITNTELLVRHGGGEERIYLSNAKAVIRALGILDSDSRYWLLNAMFHAQSKARLDGRDAEAARWKTAAANKRIKTRKARGRSAVKVWIEA